jgi:uncharacterized protein YdhG (YjbR/CyaY superfamily)
MEPKNSTPQNINDYISRFPPSIQEHLEKIRQVIKKAVPEAKEVISYQMPAFRYAGYMLIFFAAHDKHIGLYPVSIDNPSFLPEITRYTSGKATLQFPYDQPMPYDLIKKIVQFKALENEARSAYKKASN